MAGTKQAALAKARQRRAEMDRDRAARDARVEVAAAEVFVQQQVRVDAEQAVAQADLAIGAALRLLLEDNVSVDDVAQLCDVSVSEVRRLTRNQPRADQAQSQASGEQEQPVAEADAAAGQSPTGARVTELRPRGDSARADASATAGQRDGGHAARRAE